MARLFVLDTTSKSIVANTVLTSSSIDFICTYADNTGAVFTEKGNEGKITSNTNTTIVPPPASDVRRVVKTINLYNSGTATQTIRIYLDSGGTLIFLTTVVLAVNNTWSLDDVGTLVSTSAISTNTVYRNLLVNGNFSVSQRTAPGVTPEYTNSTRSKNRGGYYTHDRWFGLSSIAAGSLPNTTTTGINILQGSSLISGSTNNADTSCVLAGTGVTVSKFGIAQAISGAGLANTTLTLSFNAKATSLTTVTNIKAAIIAYTGTAFTRMFVNNWGAFGVNPIYASNFSNLGVLQSDTTLSDVNWKDYSVTASTGSTAPLFIVAFIWCEGNLNPLSSDVYIQNVQLEIGPTVTAFENIALEDNQFRCYPYYYIQYAGYYGSGYWLTNTATNSQTFNVFMPLPVKMRTAPTLEVFSDFGKIINTTTLGATVGSTVVNGAMTASGMPWGTGSGTTADNLAIIVKTTTAAGTNNNNTAFNAFPNAGYLKIDNEIIKYTSKETSNVTVGAATVAVNKFKGLSRGAENSTAISFFAAHADGATVSFYGNALFGDLYTLAAADPNRRASLLSATLAASPLSAQALNITLARNAINSAISTKMASGVDVLTGGNSESFLAANAEI